MNSLSLRTRMLLLPVAAVVLSFGLSACSSTPTPIDRDETGEVAEANESADVFAMAVGDCTNDDPNAGEQVSTVAVVPCSEEHDNEAYLSAQLSGDEYPGDEEVASQADTICYDAFADFVGIDYASSRLAYFPYTPTEQSWDGAHDREVLCMVYDAEYAKLTGSAAGIAE
jgi:hypothetical protein